MITGPSTLILGGTAEARALAAAATVEQLPILSSLAGRVSRPALPEGPVRIGGFGGVAGLVEFLRAERIRAVVDATHPFAATMSASAVRAADVTGVPLLRLARPGWSERPDAPGWHWVDTTPLACVAAMDLGRRAFLTTGRQTLPDFEPMAERYALTRVVEPVTDGLPPAWELRIDRGPYAVDGELELMRDRRVDVLVTKDSGGSYTSAKLDAAARLEIPVVVVRRPVAPNSAGAAADTVAAALAWLRMLPVS